MRTPLLARQRAVVGARDLALHGAPSAASACASSLMRSASRSASRRLLTKTIVERCARTSSSSAG